MNQLAIRPGLSPERLERRRQGIFASDSPALFLEPEDVYGATPADIWAEKVYPLKPRPATDEMTLGLLMEPTLAYYAMHQLGCDIERDIEILPAKGKILGANLDARAKLPNGRRAVMEFKYVGEHQAHYWGEEPRESVVIQLHHQMLVDGAEEAYAFAGIVSGGTLSLTTYKVPRDEEIIELIDTETRRFWEEHVVPKVKPTNWPVSVEVAQRIPRVEGKRVKVADNIYVNFEAAREALSLATKEADRCKAELLDALGDGEIAVTSHGEIRFAEESAGVRIDAKALQEAHPEIFAEFARKATRRVPRMKAAL